MYPDNVIISVSSPLRSHVDPWPLSLDPVYSVQSPHFEPRSPRLKKVDRHREKKVGALIAFYRALASRIFRTWGKD